MKTLDASTNNTPYSSTESKLMSNKSDIVWTALPYQSHLQSSIELINALNNLNIIPSSDTNSLPNHSLQGFTLIQIGIYQEQLANWQKSLHIIPWHDGITESTESLICLLAMSTGDHIISSGLLCSLF